MKDNAVLESLHLDHNNVEDAGAIALAEGLKANEGRAGIGIAFGDSTETKNVDGTTTIAQIITDKLPAKEVCPSRQLTSSQVALRN